MNKITITSFEQIPYGMNLILNELESLKERLANSEISRKMQDSSPEKKILTSDDICELLRMKKSTLYCHTSSNKIPYYKSNGRIYFDSDEINAWIHLNKRKTIKELQEEANCQIKRK